MRDLNIQTKTILVTLPEDLHKRLSIYCIEKDFKKSAFIRQAIIKKMASEVDDVK